MEIPIQIIMIFVLKTHVYSFIFTFFGNARVTTLQHS